MAVLLFEDDQVRQLHPTTLGKPAFAITVGSYRLIDLMPLVGQPLDVVVRLHLRQIVDEDFRTLFASRDGSPQPVLYVNSRLVPAVRSVQKLRALLEAGRPCSVHTGNAIAAALVPADRAAQLAARDGTQPALDGDQSLPHRLAALGLEPCDVELPLLEYPHDIIRNHPLILSENLAHRIAHGQYEQRSDGLFVAPEATVGQFVVTDTTHGPVVIEQGASIGPYCLLTGPVHVGPNARVLEHAALKDGVTIGHTAKIGGEVESSIIEPYTNKQHHGFLGHSYLGSWINLGAGTCNSDLKNTYGHVNMEYFGRKVPTGMQFVGAIIGDYAKTAINTGIFTGKTIGVCSMVYGFVTTNVPSFVNYARLFGQVSEAPVEVMVATQRRMYARRNVEQRPCDIQLLHDMHELTAHERRIPGETLSLEPLSL